MCQVAFVLYLMRSSVYPTSACEHVALFGNSLPVIQANWHMHAWNTRALSCTSNTKLGFEVPNNIQSLHRTVSACLIRSHPDLFLCVISQTTISLMCPRCICVPDVPVFVWCFLMFASRILTLLPASLCAPRVLQLGESSTTQPPVWKHQGTVYGRIYPKVLFGFA